MPYSFAADDAAAAATSAATSFYFVYEIQLKSAKKEVQRPTKSERESERARGKRNQIIDTRKQAANLPANSSSNIGSSSSSSLPMRLAHTNKKTTTTAKQKISKKKKN